MHSVFSVTSVRRSPMINTKSNSLYHFYKGFILLGQRVTTLLITILFHQQCFLLKTIGTLERESKTATDWFKENNVTKNADKFIETIFKYE